MVVSANPNASEKGLYALESAEAFAMRRKMAPRVSATSCLTKKGSMCHATLILMSVLSLSKQHCTWFYNGKP